MATNTAVHPSAVNVGVPTASLYVGDLHPDVTEAMLFDKFSTAGQVLSIRVCRDAISRVSLGYAYVNFQQHADAERALENMNFDSLLGRPIRIMWSQRDPSIRRTGAGNIFIKNLDKSIDTKSIYETFSMFGNILSCKVACDLDGNSKGYGFIHFEIEANAISAIEKINGKLLDGKIVVVEKFIPRAARLKSLNEGGKRFNNVYIKNYGDELDKEKLETLFKPFGSIISSVVMMDENNVSRGFGFVCFEEAEAAEQAVEKMNNFALKGSDHVLTVCRAQKKSERQAELRRRYEMLKIERIRRYQGVNLYVKNLDDSLTDELLRQHFEPFGSIASVKVMCDENGRSKGFGFVCFEKPDDATKAVVEMNNKIITCKPLYVALAQRKEDRRAQLASQYMQRLAAMRMQNPAGVPGTVYTPATSGYFVQTQMQNQRTSYLPSHNALNAGAQIRNQRNQRWTNISTTGLNPLSNMNSGYTAFNSNNSNNYSKSRPPPRFNRPSPIGPQGSRSFNIAEHKQIIGGRLYAAISNICKSDVDISKLTGMLLEADSSDLTEMLALPDVLQAKVNEALTVLTESKGISS